MAKHVIEDKRLMAEWDWEKNNECGLNPHHLTMGSRAKAWWRFKKA